MKTSIASHANDLSPLIKASGKSCVTIFADGGADFNVNHITNEWYYMKIFKNLNLDVLLATTHCPGKMFVLQVRVHLQGLQQKSPQTISP